MLSLFTTALVYNTLLIACVLLINGYYKSYSSQGNLESPHKNRRIILAYLFLCFYSVIRYDIGADYENTVYDIIEIAKSIRNGATVSAYIGERMKEPGFFFLTFLFYHFPSTHIWVIGAYSIIFFLFLYKLLDAYNGHLWGIVVLFLSLIIFQAWDWIRQGTAMAIWLYSIHLFNIKKFKKSILTAILSAFFHYSVLLIIPVAIIANAVKLKNKLMACIMLVFFILVCLGVFTFVYESILSLVPFYGELYLSSTKYASFDEQSFSNVPFVLTSLWYIFLVFISDEEHHPWSELVFIGSLIFMASGGSLLMDRLAWLFTCSQLVLVPLIVRDNKRKIYRSIFVVFILCHIVLLNRRFFVEGEARGCVPYQTVFSDEASHLQFRYKEY